MPTPRLATVEAARAWFAPRLCALGHERLCVAHLDEAGRVLGETALDGDPHRVALDLRRVFADALRLEARALLLAHNHPRGRPEPSPDDLEATRKLAAVADALGILLRDHLILLPDGAAISFRARALL